MAAKSKLADEIRATTQKAKAADKQSKKKGTGLPKNPASNAYVAPHRHCLVCSVPVSIKKDPAVCGDSNCSDEHEKRQRSRKRWNIMLYVAPGIMILSFILPYALRGG